MDRTKASEWDADRAGNLAEKERDFGGVWVDHYDLDGVEGGPNDSWADDRVILNVAFTGSLARHERELRKVWGGPLCLTKTDRTLRELRAILDEVAEDLRDELLSTSVDESQGTVVVDVIAIDPATEAAIEERYGSGLVEFEQRLQPVE